MIKYRANPDKILEGVVWLANQLPGIDQYQVVKMFFFADKKHLNAYGRPIFGDKYVAMDHGPVPSFTFDAIRRNKFVDAAFVRLLEEALEFSPRGNRIKMRAKREADLDEFSGTDIEMLSQSFEENKNKSFGELREETHSDPAWATAWDARGMSMNPDMDFRLFIDESDEADNTIEFMETTCGCAVL